MAGELDADINSRTSGITIPANGQRRRQSIMMLSESVKSRRSLRSHSRVIPAAATPPLGKSIESNALIDVGSPSFKSPNLEHEAEIIQSLKQNYLRDNFNKSNSFSQLSKKSHSSTLQDSDAPSETEISIPEHDSNLNTEGGDILRDLYKLSSNLDNNVKKNRNKSADDLSISGAHRRKGSTASALNVPGGFRREYIVQKIRNELPRQNCTTDSESHHTTPSYGSVTSSNLEDQNNVADKVPFLTRNFLEFLYVYGHFAGETFNDDFAVDEDDEFNESEVPLLNASDRERLGHKKRVIARPSQVKTSTFKAFLLMLKSFIGTGVLFLPSAFANGGLIFSVLMLSFFGMYSYWCYYILIRSKVATGVSSFGDIGIKLYGPWMRYAILASLILTQLGFSAAYVVFTCKNLLAFFQNVFHLHSLRIEHLLILQTIIFIPLAFIRNVSKLSLTSLLANFFTMAGLIIIVFFVVKHLVIDLDLKPEDGIIYGFNSSKWSLFIGTAIFAFEGIGLIIPVQDSMRKPEKFPLVLGLVILTATVLFISVATLGYLAFGRYIETVILLNLPQDNIFVNLVQFFYSLAILLSTPLQLFPAIGIIESKLVPKFRKTVSPTNKNDVQLSPNSGKLDWKVKWTKNFLRSIIVIFVICLAYFGSSKLDVFVSFIGCFACIPLVYMYPPLLHLKSCSQPAYKQNQTLKNRLMITLDYGLVIFGGVSMLYTSYQCIMG
ncbi:Avt4 [Kluyveromyces lactis]|nr:Avt4 [Kluyveromyces lactis]